MLPEIFTVSDVKVETETAGQVKQEAVAVDLNLNLKVIKKSNSTVTNTNIRSSFLIMLLQKYQELTFIKMQMKILRESK